MGGSSDAGLLLQEPEGRWEPEVSFQVRVERSQGKKKGGGEKKGKKNQKTNNKVFQGSLRPAVLPRRRSHARGIGSRAVAASCSRAATCRPEPPPGRRSPAQPAPAPALGKGWLLREDAGGAGEVKREREAQGCGGCRWPRTVLAVAVVWGTSGSPNELPE